MQLKDRTTIIDENNMNDLIEVYGKINFDDLKRIVNNYMRVAIDEIREDLSNGK